LIWQKTYDLATLAKALCSPARPFIMSIIFQILNMKMTLKYKINIFRQYLGYRYYICPLKPSAGLPILMRLSL
jgi:hypothetical protein